MTHPAFHRTLLSASSVLLLSACSGGGTNTASTEALNTTSNTDTETSTVVSAAEAATQSTPWIINTQTRSRYIFEDNSNQGVLVNVQAAESTDINGESYTKVTATGIPDYEVTLTQAQIDTLNARPKASTDFTGGATLANAGQTVQFGQDIGFNSSQTNCTSTGGDGYWPPGPVCPKNVAHESYFPASPTPTSSLCLTGLGAQGYWVNGTSIYQWSDGQSYNNQGVWQTLAPVAEQYDVDICGGHAANGDYHHHFHSSCLAEKVQDQGQAHSPVYGYAADGYPIYGPWEGAGVLAKSSWRIRDYDNASSATGCGVSGQRSCVMKDVYDPSQGTVAATSNGPTTQGTYRSLSGNTFSTVAGFFYQDYYWDSALTAQGGAYLDQHNGHSDAERGYHYHVTATQDAQNHLTPAFPYTIGPTFYGTLKDHAMTTCGTSSGTGMLPPPRR
ncbi:MAG: YHYH protein [Hahellaceae bacterium]|nr:YHYH protein [Hahellaceae bacterium]